MTRIISIFLLLLSFAVLDTTAQRRPNILLIMTDDQGYGDFSLHGNPHVRTPHLDRFAQAGLQFERFFVSPLCAPTRASLLTGRYHLRTGVWGVTFGRETMRAEETTIAEILKANGYRTGLFGKWHNGEQYPYTPQGQGFDEFLGFHNGHWNLYFDSTLLKGAQFVETKGYISDVLTDAALKFIEKNRQQPFFCYVPFNAPHGPYQTPDKYFDKYKAMGLDDTLASIYGMVENIDDNVGRLLAKLDELKLRDNTIVVFLTDNGPQTDRYNAGMRARKGSVHEGGVRAPLFIQYPARFKTPRVISNIAAHIDLLPTLLELCNVPLPPNVMVDGVSLAPYLNGKVEAAQRYLFTHNNGARDVTMFSGAVRDQRYRLVNEGRGYELYDLQNDPGQKQNIAAEKPDVARTMSQAYEAWFRDVTQRGFTRFPTQIGHAQENPVFIYAPQAEFRGLRFFGRNGFANDWLTGWDDLAATAAWKLEVVKAGTYEVTLGYRCADEDAGSLVQATIGAARLTGRTSGTDSLPELKMPDRVVRNEVNERKWAQLALGKIKLPAGAATLTVQALEKKRGNVLDLKYVLLRRL